MYQSSQQDKIPKNRHRQQNKLIQNIETKYTRNPPKMANLTYYIIEKRYNKLLIRKHTRIASYITINITWSGNNQLNIRRH